MTEEPDHKERAAEAFYWKSLEETLRRQGAAESVPHVRQLLRVQVAEVAAQGRYTRVKLRVEQRTSDYLACYNAQSGERLSWYFRALAEDSERSLPEAPLLEAAAAAAKPPADAVLDEHRYRQVGDAWRYSARWKHLFEGLPVEGDFIHVDVNGATGRAFNMMRAWRQPARPARWL